MCSQMDIFNKIKFPIYLKKQKKLTFGINNINEIFLILRFLKATTIYNNSLKLWVVAGLIIKKALMKCIFVILHAKPKLYTFINVYVYVYIHNEFTNVQLKQKKNQFHNFQLVKKNKFV